MSKLKRLIILAPNDRYNYGDLLFSHIIKHHLSGFYDEVVNVATVKADLRSVGGDQVEPLTYIYNLSDDYVNHLIVAGGESFFSDWYFALSYIDLNFQKYTNLLYKILTKLNLKWPIFKFSKLYSKISLGATTDFPYTIGKFEIKNVDRVFYNSLGSSSLSQKLLNQNNVCEILKSIDYISLRDEHSNKMLLDYGFENNLVPDCAIKMSEYYDSLFLLERAHDRVVNFALNNKGAYFVFQINKVLGANNFSDIISLLINVYSKYKMEICLCPVGFALGHEDDVILERISQELNELSIPNFFSRDLNIWDIMLLISSSSLYIGTSLHGAITSMSYKVPYIGILVNKTIQYINTWGLGNIGISKNIDVMSKVDFIKSNNSEVRNELIKSYENQKSTLDGSFLRMKSIIERSL